MKLVYCDYIAVKIHSALKKIDVKESPVDFMVGHINMDLHPTHGYFVSTKKVINVIDEKGTKYKITIEEDTEAK